MDLIVLLLLVILTLIFFRRFSNVIYIICIIDMFLRILDRLEHLMCIPEFSNLVNKYFHNSILEIINAYTTGIVNLILVWLLLVVYIIFLVYVIRTFFRKKK